LGFEIIETKIRFKICPSLISLQFVSTTQKRIVGVVSHSVMRSS